MFETILVCLDGGERDARHIEIAGRLTPRKGAIIGLHVAEPFAPSQGFALSAAFSPSIEVQQHYNDAVLDRAEKVRERAEEEAKARGLRIEWRFVFADIPAAIAAHGDCADLTIMGQVDTDAENNETPRDLPAQVALEAAGPVLVIPANGAVETIGTHALVAWNWRREAARALRDVLPMLAKAKAVDLLIVDAEPRYGMTEDALTGFLSRLGAKAEIVGASDEGLDIGAQIVASAAARGADLIVMGAYGHGRLRQLVLGGATRDVLGAMTIPVLLSH
jgi:nucleotide-binding universal stress UspA family protein